MIKFSNIIKFLFLFSLIVGGCEYKCVIEEEEKALYTGIGYSARLSLDSRSSPYIFHIVYNDSGRFRYITYKDDRGSWRSIELDSDPLAYSIGNYKRTDTFSYGGSEDSLLFLIDEDDRFHIVTKSLYTSYYYFKGDLEDGWSRVSFTIDQLKEVLDIEKYIYVIGSYPITNDSIFIIFFNEKESMGGYYLGEVKSNGEIDMEPIVEFEEGEVKSLISYYLFKPTNYILNENRLCISAKSREINYLCIDLDSRELVEEGRVKENSLSYFLNDNYPPDHLLLNIVITKDIEEGVCPEGNCTTIYEAKRGGNSQWSIEPIYLDRIDIPWNEQVISCVDFRDGVIAFVVKNKGWEGEKAYLVYRTDEVEDWSIEEIPLEVEYIDNVELRVDSIGCIHLLVSTCDIEDGEGWIYDRIHYSAILRLDLYYMVWDGKTWSIEKVELND